MNSDDQLLVVPLIKQQIHTDTVKNLVFVDEHQKYFATGSHDETIQLWSFQTLQLITTLVFKKGFVSCLLGCPHVKGHLISYHSRGFLNLWFLQKQKVVDCFNFNNRVVYEMRFINESSLVLSTGDCEINLIRCFPFRIQHVFKFSELVRTFDISLKNQKLFIAQKNEIIISQIQEDKLLLCPNLTWEEEGILLKQNIELKIYDQFINSEGYDQFITLIYHDRNSQFLYAGNVQGHIYQWNWKTRTILKEFSNHLSNILGLMVLENYLISCSFDQRVLLWIDTNSTQKSSTEVIERKPFMKLLGHNMAVCGVYIKKTEIARTQTEQQIIGDKLTIISWSVDQTMCMWEIENKVVK